MQSASGLYGSAPRVFDCCSDHTSALFTKLQNNERSAKRRIEELNPYLREGGEV